MSTKLVGPCVDEDSMEISSIPPGFESFVPLTLRKMDDNHASNYSRSAGASESYNIKLEMDHDCSDNSKTSKSVKRRPLVTDNQSDNSLGDESESVQVLLRNRLPKGVIRGCETCKNCQKVTAKWNPNEARRPDLEEAPVFYPSEEEFEDTLRYISSIRPKAEKYGICRIVPPPSWKPPCPLRGRNVWEMSKFITRVQRIDKLQNRFSMRKIFEASNEKATKKKRCLKTGGDHGNSTQEIQIPTYERLYEAERFGFEPGPDFTLDAFQKYADVFKAQYFRRNDCSSNSGGSMSVHEEQWQPSAEDIEGEYWRMVEKPTEEIEVLYGADLETGSFGSGFPKNSQQVTSASDAKYIYSGWNLNNFPRLPGSVLSFESSDISGVLVPWLYIGMCFSSFCWHVEDHHLYSLNYMHWGSPKMWYGVPASDAPKLEAAMKKHLCDLFEEQPDLLHKLVTQISPSILRSEGVSVYRCVQNPGEFVLTFPRAYHAGFNCGFNCAEAVNVAPVDWLPHGQYAIELYRDQGRQTSISHDKLLLGAAREAVKANWEYNLLRKHTSDNLKWKEVCGKEGILSKALKTRVEMERIRRESLCKSSQALKMESSFDANSERECSVCLFDLHLSAAGCHRCSPNKYACLNHAEQLCSCSWGTKFFLFRYGISELNILVDALEGKLSAVYRWAKHDLGLALSSYVSKENTQGSRPISKLSPTPPVVVPKEITSPEKVVVPINQSDGSVLNLTNHTGNNHSSENLKPPMVILALENVKSLSNVTPQEVESTNKNSLSTKENSSPSDIRYKAARLLSEIKDLNKSAPSEYGVLRKYEGQSSSYLENKDLILLSDDEGDMPSEKPSWENRTSEKNSMSIQKPISAEKEATQVDPNNVFSTLVVADPSGMLEPEKLPSSSVSIKVESCAESERHGITPDSACVKLTDFDYNKDIPMDKETHSCNDKNADCRPIQQINYDKRQKCEDSHKELVVELRSADGVLTVPSSSGHQNNLDRYYRQKGGPRIAKVIRRINFNVEPLEYGTVCGGKLWSDVQAIYPKGFRSRVRYIDVTDPANMCYYVSEILDASRDAPLFMVSVEHCPSEVFVHVSASKCWEMVRERVNHEIAKQHKLGRAKLPPLQPPGCLDGMELFGFTSPAILQAIQAMDQSRTCTEYWKSQPLMQIPPDNNVNLNPSNEQDTSKNQRILNGLFKKATPEELQTLYSLVYNNRNSTDELSLLTRLLNEEINTHPR